MKESIMTTHYSEFTQKLDSGIPANVYCHKVDEKDFYRLYDGNSFHAGNLNHHACIASKLSESEARDAVDLAKQDPKAFAEAYL
jgi:hypothetical protein